MTTPIADRRLDLGVLVGAATVAVVLVLSFVTPAQLIGVLAVGPILTSLMTTARRTAELAVVTVGCAVASALWTESRGTFDWVVRVGLCALLCVLAVQGAALRESRESSLKRMTVIAEAAQQAVLRAMPTAIGSIGLAARYVSASKEALVGGDLYEVAATPYGVRVIVGDVRGKGLEAVQTAATVLGAFRAAAFTEPDPAALARTIDATLGRMLDDEEFVTAIVGEFREDRIALANCGHHPPVLVVDHRAIAVDTGEPTVPLGLGAQPVLTEHLWPVGARMLFYTDGLVETRDARGEFFPLGDVAPELADGSLEEALDRLVGQMLEHGGQRMADDLALVLAEGRRQ